MVKTRSQKNQKTLEMDMFNPKKFKGNKGYENIFDSSDSESDYDEVEDPIEDPIEATIQT